MSATRDPGAPTTPERRTGPLDALALRWRALPRAARWAAFGAVGIALYFGAVDPILLATNDLNAKADLAALQLRQYDTQEASRSEALSRIALGTSAFGPIEAPAKSPALVSRVSDQIARILGERGVTEWNVQTLRGMTLGRAVLPSLYKPDSEELQRVQFTVTLTDKTSTVLGVIADLERIPEIAAINSAQLRRTDKTNDRISATLTPEVWVIVPKESAR